ncbi:EamA family transporter RarD [Lysobacter brunescens]|uniref:EamA family transporter RarD n=1 Tax=Lysobacter brunescens TaxID=262323 RepID=A0ABW2Y9B9_9GAMM
MSPTVSPGLDRKGLAIAIGAFVIWGLMPLYWHLLKIVPALQIVAHRVLWSAVLVALWLAWSQARGWFAAILRNRRLAAMLTLAGLCIGLNWSLFIWAVNAGHVVETSLGYFINPLLSVLIGVLFLRERLNALQWTSVGIAACGVLWLTFNYGSFPWIALSLAASFGAYGLIRKLAPVDSVAGLGFENAVLLLPALALLVSQEFSGQGGFLPGASAWGWGVDLLLIFGGALTALPLIGFAYAVRRVPLSTVGLMQYISPTLSFLTGVFFFHEPFDRDRAIGFVFIWIALALFMTDSLRRARAAQAG